MKRVRKRKEAGVKEEIIREEMKKIGELATKIQELIKKWVPDIEDY